MDKFCQLLNFQSKADVFFCIWFFHSTCFEVLSSMLCIAVLSSFDTEQLDHDLVIYLVLVATWMVFRWDCSEYSCPDHSQVSVGPYPKVGFAGSWCMNVHPYMMFDTMHRLPFLFHVMISLFFSTVAVAGMPPLLQECSLRKSPHPLLVFWLHTKPRAAGGGKGP